MKRFSECSSRSECCRSWCCRRSPASPRSRPRSGCDDSESAMDAAVVEALTTVVARRPGHGSLHIQLTRAAIVEHAVVIRILATDTRRTGEPRAPDSPDESSPPSSTTHPGVRTTHRASRRSGCDGQNVGRSEMEAWDEERRETPGPRARGDLAIGRVRNTARGRCEGIPSKCWLRPIRAEAADTRPSSRSWSRCRR